MNNAHYDAIEFTRLPLKKALVRHSPQWDGMSESAGLLTTRRWAEEHYRGGTNRRAVKFAFQEFLCAPISEWKNSALPDYYVRRDIDRAPAGKAVTYQNECRACHAPMDAMGGAFANLDFVDKTFTGAFDWVAPKMNQNSDVFPAGHQVTSAAWVNLMSQSEYAYFGWRSPLDGVGIHAFGEMLASSKAFSQCMVKRVYEKVCRRKADEATIRDLSELTDRFEANDHRLRWLFEQVAIHPTCAWENR